ncbi:MAG: PLP-dependent aminotransferase family protein [Patescibacteria group bacterium]
MNLNKLKSKRVKAMEYSALSELLRVTANSEIISLAGGLPAPESFPLKIIKELNDLVLKKYEGASLQYGPTDGAKILKEEIAIWLGERNIKTTADNIGVTSGSQGALDTIGRIFIDEGDSIAVESPTYIGAVDAFTPYGPSYEEIKTDDDGAIPESLEKILKTKKVKFVYLVPTFQNPTGRTITWERRKQIAEIIKKYDTLLIEDDPYNSLRYCGKAVDPIQTMIQENTVYLCTFSKVLAPGLRIGFYSAPKNIAALMVSAKQSVDLHTNSYGQYLAAEYLKTGYLKKHLPKILKIYKSKQEAMLKALEKYFPKSFQWTRPEGGMFIWATGPKHFDAIDLYWKAIKNNVAFVPGTYFFAKLGEGKNTFRLNFTNVGEKQIKIAIKKLSEIIKKT